jgi:hypothetical protein
MIIIGINSILKLMIESMYMNNRMQLINRNKFNPEFGIR